MPLKKRNFVRSIGSVTAGTYSDEVDMSNVTRGVLYVTPDSSYSANFDIEVYMSPQEFGTTPTWYRLWGIHWPDTVIAINVDVGYNPFLENSGGPQAIPFPLPYKIYDADRSYSSESVTPRRIRFRPVGTDVSLSIEGMRMVS